MQTNEKKSTKIKILPYPAFVLMSASLIHWTQAEPLFLSSKSNTQNTSYQIAKASQKTSSKIKRKKNRRKKNRRRKNTVRKNRFNKKRLNRQYAVDQKFTQLFSLYNKKKYKEVSEKAFRLILHPSFKRYKNSLRFLLGSSLYNLKLYQGASFQFASVIRDTKNKNLIKKNLTNLYLAANQIDHPTLIRFALSKINLKDFPKKHKDLLYLRIGEKYLENKDFKSAIKILKRIPRQSSIYLKSKYLLAFAYSELKRNRSALRAFQELLLLRSEFPKNDSIKTAALIGKARVLYQGKKWNQAIEIYNQIPKDTELWHNSLIEKSWAYLRSRKFRLALSILHSLHSSFYEHFYAPELLLLRSIIYLYICKYDEMEKTLDLYKKIYKKLQREIKLYLNNISNSSTYFVDILKTIQDVKDKEFSSLKHPVPPLVAFRIHKDGEFQDILKYIQKLKQERQILRSMPALWQTASVGKYVTKLIRLQMAKAHQIAGEIARKKMRDIHNELLNLSAQAELIRFEMINTKKEIIKKFITKELKKTQLIDKTKKRSFYVQNGYNYWPFEGEYWLDEVGNHYYFGTTSCQKYSKK